MFKITTLLNAEKLSLKHFLIFLSNSREKKMGYYLFADNNNGNNDV